MARANRLAFLIPGLALAAFGSPGPAGAQSAVQRPGAVAPQPSIARPIVQAVPGGDSRALDAALGRLARDPRDIEALIDAGNAALAMGDVDAATGFFRRADQVSPGNGRVKAGLAGAMVRNGDPFDAIPLFDEAEKAGALNGQFAADRGLAYDLVGDNATAQGFYRQALMRGPSEEAVQRLALSYAIAGDKHNAELILSPLLAQRNLAAWRTRAFALAILGQTEEAVSIANTILPADIAAGVAPYLRYMPRLTRAQQAAAANFGAFPRASEIGRDDPRVAQFAPRRTGVAAADAALVPQGEALGRSSRSRDRNRTRQRDRTARQQQETARSVAPPEPQPARATGSLALAPAPAPAAPAAPIAMAPAQSAPAQFPSASAISAQHPPSAPAAPAPAPVAPPAGSLAAASPGFTLVPSAPTPTAPPPVPPPAAPASPPVSAPPTAAPAAAPLPRSLADAFAEFERPSTDATPAAGAVDLRGLKLSRAEAKKPVAPPKPPPPSHPSRIWVQVATGRDKGALGFDWRRLTREAAQAMRGKAPFVTAWGQSNRLLAGPFQSEAAANSFIAQLRRADVDGAFVWTSPAGQVVDTLQAGGGRR